MTGMDRIELAGDYGDPESHRALGAMHHQLRNCLTKYLVNEYCKDVYQFSVILRVSGKLANFGTGGVDRMRRNRKKSYITADLCIPEAKWKGKSKEELQDLLLNGVRHTLELEVARLLKDKEEVNEKQLWQDVGLAFECFRKKTI